MPLRLMSLSALVALGACGPPGETGPSSIALERDFAGYRDWTRYELGADAGVIDPAHTSAPRTVFINRQPDAGLTAFPDGTLIVKEAPFNIFAMGKRGGAYNANGARGWEWFELLRDEATGRVTIKWRGLGPPAGESYGKAGQSCNDCHKAFTANDSVMSPPLQLGRP